MLVETTPLFLIKDFYQAILKYSTHCVVVSVLIINIFSVCKTSSQVIRKKHENCGKEALLKCFR